METERTQICNRDATRSKYRGHSKEPERKQRGHIEETQKKQQGNKGINEETRMSQRGNRYEDGKETLRKRRGTKDELLLALMLDCIIGWQV